MVKNYAKLFKCTYGNNCRDLNAEFEWIDDWVNRWLHVMVTLHSLCSVNPFVVWAIVVGSTDDPNQTLSVEALNVVNSIELILSVNSLLNDIDLKWKCFSLFFNHNSMLIVLIFFHSTSHEFKMWKCGNFKTYHFDHLLCT